MTRDEILRKLRELMESASREKVDWEGVTETSEIADLGFDSLTILDLIYDIQQEFDLEFEAEEMVEIRTVGQLAEFLEEKSA